MILLEALQYAKMLKRPIVYITSGYVLGADEGFSTISSIILNEPVEDLERPICSKFSDILSEESKVTKFMATNPSMFYNYYSEVSPGIYINTFDEDDLQYDMMRLYRKCNSLIEDAICVEKLKDIVKTAEEFESLYGIKSSEGVDIIPYKRNDINFFISNFASIHPLTKTDVLNLDLYTIDDRSFLARFELVKKKNIVIEEFIRYRYLE